MPEITPVSSPRPFDARRRLSQAADTAGREVATLAAQVGDRLALSTRVAAIPADAPAKVAAQAEGLWGGLKGFLGDVPGKLRAAADWTVDKVTKGVEWGVKQFEVHVLGATHGEVTSIKDENDPSDVNDPSYTDVEAAKKGLAKDAQAEAAALAKLPAADRAAYEAVRAKLGGSTLAQRGLQAMLLDGRLPGAQDVRGGGTLLAHLHGLATQPLDPAVDRNSLVAETVAEVENPVRVNQHGKGTCGATTAQIMLLRQHPAEYVRIIRDLASSAGEARLAGGATLKRPADWQATNDLGRSHPSRLFQAAAMDLSVPGVVRYDNTEDKHWLGPIPVGTGMSSGGLAKVLSNLYGSDFGSTTAWRWNREQVWADTKQRLARGEGPFPTSLTWGDDGGHWVQVDKVADGRVFFTNPWGVEQSMAEADFFSHLKTVVKPG